MTDPTDPGQRPWTDRSPQRTHRRPADHGKVLSVPSTREAQAGATGGRPLQPVGAAAVSKPAHARGRGGWGDQETLVAAVGGQAVRPPWETVWKLRRLLFYPLPSSVPKASCRKGLHSQGKNKTEQRRCHREGRNPGLRRQVSRGDCTQNGNEPSPRTPGRFLGLRHSPPATPQAA
uniref:Uncharacterized protein n=1 Tax=Pipistrellus kuhlii TaxID=59472 RepID=A0A7J7TW10_PIPKU|nr:hypothetical protein mPipKuh1_009232 [Pipistrellus kuhlii]